MKPEEYARMYAAEERQWWYVGMRAVSDALLEGRLQAGVRLRLLDAGCGTGSNLMHLGSHGRALGVDLSEEALRFCQRRGAVTARGSVLALPFPPAAFDLVTSFDVLYHSWVSDDRAALAELVRVTRPGGLLLVRVPALELLRGAHDEAVLSRHRYTRGEVVRLMTGCGLTVLRASYCNSLLFPLLLLRRSLDRLTGRHGSDVGFLPAPFEALFRTLMLAEARLLRVLNLPLGASIVALGRKPASP